MIDVSTQCADLTCDVLVIALLVAVIVTVTALVTAIVAIPVRSTGAVLAIVPVTITTPSPPLVPVTLPILAPAPALAQPSYYNTHNPPPPHKGFILSPASRLRPFATLLLRHSATWLQASPANCNPSNAPTYYVLVCYQGYICICDNIPTQSLIQSSQ